MRIKEFSLILLLFVFFSCVCVVSADSSTDGVHTVSGGVDDVAIVSVDSSVDISGSVNVIGDGDNISSDSSLNDDSVNAVNNNGVNNVLMASVTDNGSDVLGADYQYSFSALQNLINSHEAGDTVDLLVNYKYDSTYDTSLIDGITINKSLFINGNGHTIDANKIARIFYVTVGNVAFHNVTFSNAYRQYSPNDTSQFKIHGGALFFTTATNIRFTWCKFNLIEIYRSSYNSVGSGIYAKSVNHFDVLNCTFTGSNAYLCYQGGAIFFEGSHIMVKDSNFTNVRTTQEGGSLFFQGTRSNITVENCRFTGTNTEPDSIVYVANGADVLINNNYFNCQAYNGIVEVGTARNNVKITWNNFTNCYTSYEGPIFLGAGKHANVLISHNMLTNGNYGYRPFMLRSAAGSGTITVEWNYFNGVNSRTESGMITIWDPNYARVNVYNNTFVNCRSQTFGGCIRTTSVTYVQDNNFTNCYLHGNGDTIYSRGVGVYATNYAYIDNNNFIGNYYSAIPLIAEGIIYISPTGTGVITNNNFTNNRIRQSHSSHTGIIHNEGNNTIIANNSLKDSNCSDASGGIIYNLGNNVTIFNINISNVVAGTGGSIYNGGNNVNISKVNVALSSADTGGAFYILGDTVNITDCNFSKCHADNYGVIYCGAPNSRLYNDNYLDNYAVTQGVLAIESNVQVIKQNFTRNNVTNGYAGTILIIGNDNYLNDINISKTFALEGGAIYITGDYNNLSNINIVESSATSTHGGAVYSSGSYLNITNLTVLKSNASLDGGAIYNTGVGSNIHNASFTEVHAGRNGGVIFWSGNDGNISLITINDVYAESNGGAVYWSGINGTMTNLVVKNAHATIGGVVYCVGQDTKILEGNFNNIRATGDGGAIFWTGSNANLTSIIFNNVSSGANGGAIYGTATDSSFNHLEFNDINATENGGVIYWAGARSHLYDINITNVNSFTGSGGAIYWSGDKSSIRKARFENVSSDINGAVYWTGFESYLDNVTFINCIAKDQGGAVYWTGSSSNLTNGVFINNSASNGGAVFWNAVNGNLTNISFSFNNVSADGGAIFLIGDSPFMYNLTFINNTAGFKGGAINIVGMNPVLFLLNCTNNSAGVDGGAVIIDGANAELSYSSFTNNSAVTSAGAVYVSGVDANINYIDFTSNDAGIGGALYCAGDGCTVSFTNFTSNNATTGGALYMGGLKDGLVFNATFKDNNASGSGGAVYWTSSDGTFVNSSVTGSNAREGGALYWTGDSANLNYLKFDEVSATDNGGILYISASNINVSSSNFFNSNASSGGAIYWLGADGILFNASFINNSAVLDGGAIYWMGNNANLTSVNFTNNSAGVDGGALYIVSYGAYLNTVNFTNNSVANYGGGVYWGGNGNIQNAEFKLNKAYSGSAIYNSGILDLSSAVILDNKANISSFDISYTDPASSVNIYTVLYGLDNFLNGIWTTSNNIRVNKVTYWGIDGVMESEARWIRPVEGVSESELYFDSRLANIPVSISCKRVTGEGDTITYNGNTSIYGEFNSTFSKTVMGEGNYNFTAYHSDDDYYFGYDDSAIVGVGVIHPIVKISFTDSEIYYDGDVTVKISVSTWDENLVPILGVDGLADVYIDGEFFNTFNITDNSLSKTVHLPDQYGVGIHNVSCYFYNGSDSQGHEIGHNYSNVYYFTIVKNYLPSIVDISTVNSNYYVDELFNITLTGPASYAGPIYYVAGMLNGTVVLDENGSCNITVSYPVGGQVNVFIHVRGDENYLSSSSSYSFNIIKRDLNITILNTTGYSLGNINVGDDAVFTANLSVNDTVRDVIICVDGVNYTFTVNNSLCAVNISGLSAGIHTVSASYPGDDKYNTINTNNYILTVNKVDIANISAVPVNSNITVGDDAVFDIIVNSTNSSLYPVNDVVSVTIAGKSYNVSITNNTGKLTVSGLSNGVYDLMVVYSGSDQFNPHSVSVIGAVEVSKIITDVSVSAPENISVGDNVTFDISVNSALTGYNVNGIVTVIINNQEYDALIENGTGSVVVSGLKYKSDAYDVTVVYDGDYQFVNSSTTTTVNVIRKNITSMDLIVNNTIYVGQDAILNITMDSGIPVNSFVNVTVDNKEFIVPINNNKGYLIISGLKYNASSYEISVSYDGDDMHNSYETKKTQVKVLKVDIDDISMKPDVNPIFVGDDAIFNINITPSISDYVVNGFVTVTVDGRMFNVSIKDNSGRISVSNLSNGSYKVFVSYAGDDTFNSFNNYSTVNVSSVDVVKVPTGISMNDVTLNVGDVAVIIAHINNSAVTGNVTFIVDNIEHVSSIVNGIATLEVYGLNTSANRTITATYSGDNKFLNSSNTANLIISKITDSASISVYNILAGESENVVIVLPSDITNGTITVKFNGTVLGDSDYTVRGNVILFNRTVDSVGRYTVDLTVTDDSKYDTITASNSFLVSKISDYSIFASASNIILGDNSTVRVVLPEDAADGVVVINGKSYSISEATSGVEIQGVSNAGSYSVNVAYVNSSKYVDKTVTTSYEVYKAQSNVSIEIDSVVLADEDISFTVITTNSTGKITVIINDNEYYPQNNTESIIPAGLIYGNYTVIVKLNEDNNYESSQISKNIEVVKNTVSITVEDITSPVKVGDRVVITVDFNKYISGDVVFTIGDVNYTVKVNNANQASYAFTPKVNGTYDVSVTYSGNDKYNSSTSSDAKSFTVNRIPTYLIVRNEPVFVGQDAVINVEVRDNQATGNVIITVNGKSYTASLANGKGSVIVSGLTNDTDNNVVAVYTGDDKYDSSTNTSNVIVNKVNIAFISISADKPMYYVDDNAVLTFNIMPSVDGYKLNGVLAVKIADNNYNVSIKNNTGSLIAYHLKYGVNVVNISYAGDDTFNAMVRDYASSIVVNKISVNIDADPKEQNISVGDSAVLIINVSSAVENHSVNGFATVNIAGNSYNISIINNTGRLTVYNLASGQYDVDVIYDGDSVFNFNNALGAASINVNKKPTSVLMNNVTLNVGNAAVIIARINDTSVTGNVSFTVDNKNYITGIVNGVANLTVYGLNTSANKTITVVYSGDNKFLNSSATAELIINKVSDTAVVNVYNISAGESENVVIVLPSDVTNGTVTVKFNNTVLKPQDYSINNNVIVFDRIIQISDNYTVEVSVSDDAKYNNISASAEFEVSKTENYDIIVDVDEVVLGENSTVKVTLPSDAVNGIVTINGVDYTVNQVKKGIKLPKTDTAGVHSVDVSYVDSKYANKTVTVEYNVLKSTSAVSINISDVFYVDEDIKFTVNTVNSTGNIHVFINGAEYNPSNASEYTINGGLANATYNVIVNLDADDNYGASETSKVIYIIKKPVSINLANIDSPVNVDENVVIKAVFNDTVTGNVIFEINGVNFTAAVNGNEVSYTYTPKANGTYVVKAYYGGDDKFNPNTTKIAESFTVNKIPTQLIISADPIYVGQDAVIAVEVRNNEATGNVVVTVNGRNYTVGLVDGKGNVNVHGLTNDTDNNIYAVYSGNDKYNSSVNSSDIVVNKVDINSISINPSNQVIFVGKNASFTVNIIPALDGYLVNGWVNVSVSGNSFIVPVVNNSGNLIVSGLSAGTYPVHVDYAGDTTFNSESQSFNNAIIVNKVPVSIDLTPLTQDIYVGQYASFNVSVKPDEDDYTVNGFVTVNVNGNSFNVSVTNGSGKFNVYNLEYANHTVSVSYDGDDTYLAADSVEATVNVSKVPVNINVNPVTQSIFVGDNAVLNITILPAVENYTVNGSALVTVEGVGEFNVSINNGVGYVTFYDLINATHVVHVSYDGDNVFESETFDKTVNVLVNKRPTSITMDNVTLNVGDVAVITAKVNYTDVTGNVTFTVDNKEYTAGIINGVASVNVTNLNTSANMTITAKYSGDYKYINSSTTASLNISKVNGNASIIVYNITAGETETVFINLPADTTNATVIVKFNGEIINDYIINNNVISFNRTIQSGGSYSVSISVNDDCKYLNFTNSTSFTVSKVSPENYIIGIDVNNTSVFESIPIIINLPNDANGTLSLSVDNITLIDSVNVVDGVAGYISGNLSSGNHTISVTYENEKYGSKTVSTNVFVAKIASSINVTAPVDAKVAHDIIITVIPESRSTGNITAEINGKNYTVENRAVINASDLLEGNYTVIVKLAEDDNFLESTNHTVFTVTRNDVSLTLNNISDEIRVDYPVVLHVDLTANVTGSVVFNINNVNYTVNITESDSAEYTWIPANDGLINVSASYLGNEIYYPNSSNVIMADVFRNPVVFTNISVHNIMVDDIEHVTVSLNESDATGIVIININGTEYDTSIINGSAVFNVSGLNAGTYNVIAFYGGDRKYLATNAISGEFNVSKYDAPIFITAEDIMVLDDAVIIVNVCDNASGHISIGVNGESIYLPVVDGSVSWSVSNLSAGTYEVNAVYSGDYKYLSNSTVANFTVNHYNSTFEVIHDDAGWTGENITMSVKLSDDATGNVTLSVNGNDYVVPVSDGRADFTIPMLDAGDYEVVISYSGDYKYSNASSAFNYTVNLNYPIIVSENVVKYYKGSERLYVYLTNIRGDKLANETLYITINGIIYTRTTNDNGSCSLPINLLSGEYGVSIVYNTSELYDPIEYIVNVTVLSTIVGEDMVKVFANASQYWARFTDSEGNPLADTSVTFNINGVFYTRTTDNDGWAKLNINLAAGEYIITAYNPVTGESHSNIIKVLPRIVENHDLVKRYRNASQYVVRIIGDDALPVGEGVSVEFNIHGVFYTRTTDANGYVKLNINLPEGEYIITTYHKGCTVSNTIIVLPN